jgi:hypothetical protein
MRVVYTATALRDLDEIADWLTAHYPTIALLPPLKDAYARS